MNLYDFTRSGYAKKPHFVLFGNPVAHSLSPLMYNTAAHFYNFDIRYYPIQLEQDEQNLISGFLDNEHLKGVNLTIPFKYDFLKYTNDLDAVCKKIEAVNAFVKTGSGWKGYNTDIFGFSVPLQNYAEEIYEKNAVIFGSGGAAKAVAYALNKLGIKAITVVSRQPDSVAETLRQLTTRIVSYREWTGFGRNAKLMVNATPLGMNPFLNKSPVKQNEAHFLTDTICYDLIYNPSATKFLKLAKGAGAITINGFDMLIYQGSKLFKLWTGKSFPIDIIKRTLNEELNEKD